MIGRLTGTIVETSPDGTVLLETGGGVGWEVRVPAELAPALEAAAGPVTLYIRCIVRDDAIALYGFPTRVALALFALLIQVKNVGPKHAMSVLGAMKPEEIVAALQSGDVARFKAVHGIGRKTAEMVIVELRDKIRKLSLEAAAAAPKLGGKLDEAAAALASLGFRPAEIQQALPALRELDRGGATVEDLIREALGLLTR